MKLRLPGRSRLPTLAATIAAIPLVLAVALLPGPAPARPDPGVPRAASPFLCHVEASDLALVLASSLPRPATGAAVAELSDR